MRLLALLAFVSMASAQVSAVLSGTVVDQSNQVVSGQTLPSKTWIPERSVTR